MKTSDKEMLDKLEKEIKKIDHYPVGIFLWNNDEVMTIKRGRFNSFIWLVQQNTKNEIIKLIEEMRGEE